MAVYVTKKCGHCGTIVQPTHIDNDSLKIGNPISRCFKCGTLLIDCRIKEYIMFTTLDYFKYFIWKILTGWLLGFLLGGISLAIFDNVLLLWIICVSVMLIWFMRELKDFKIEKIESIKRTKNYEYLFELYKNKCITKKQMDDFIDLYNVKIPDLKNK